MTTPRNNLQDVLRLRTANNKVEVASTETLSTGQRLSKFKPASTAQATPLASSSNVQVRRTVTTTTTTTASTSALPTFSTPGFKKFKPAVQSSTSVAYSPDVVINIPNSSSGSSSKSSSSSSSLKRSSSEFLPQSPGPSSPNVKRRKSHHDSNKENSDPVGARPTTTKSPSRLQRLNRAGPSHDPLNLQGFAFQASTSKTTAITTTVQATKMVQQHTDETGLAEFGVDDWFSGLKEKPLRDLKELLRSNTEALRQSDSMIRAYEEGTETRMDIVVVRYIRQVISSRILAIKMTISDKENMAQELYDVPLIAGSSDPIVVDIQDSRNSDSLGGSDEDEEMMWATLGDMPDIDVPPSPILAAVDPDIPSEPAIDQTKTPYYKEICRVLKDVFQLDRFRHHQLEAMNATMDKQDVFVLMPTGGGKSLCYQLPAVCHSGKTDGVTIVVSPLIALMVDQVTHLKAKGVDAELFNSDQDSEISRVVRQRLLGSGRKPRLIYLTPEKLAHSNDMQNILRKLYQDGSLARFVIDEAHTISTWGRDFRDAYVQLKRLRIDYPDTPIMALTATANAQIKEDIMTVLDIPKCLRLEQSFNRPNLNYEIRKKGKRVVADIADYIKANYAKKTGIIYCFSRNKCEEVASELRNSHDIKAKHYHAHLSPADKQRTQQAWQDGECEVIVATVAFGMGIDKADVRFVIHHQLPLTMDGYYQETGRAGRDSKEASCILYFTFNDTRGMFKVIEENDSISQDEKKRQSECILEVARYCFNGTDCRRKLILNHFGQNFNPKDCHDKCDTCREEFEVENKDMAGPARNMLELIDSMHKSVRNQRYGTNVSKTTCLNVFRGSRAKDVIEKGYDRLSLFGSGKDINRDRTDRLFDELLSRGALKEKLVSNNQGPFNSATIVLSEKADAYLYGGAKLIMPFRVSETQGPPKRQGSGSTAGKKKSKSKTNASRAESREQEQEVSLYADDDIEDPDF